MRIAGAMTILVVFSLVLFPTVSSFSNINENLSGGENKILEVFKPRGTYVEASGTFAFFGSNRAEGAFSLTAVVERNESTFLGMFTANDITYTIVVIQTYNVRLDYSGYKLYIYGKWMIMGSTFPPYIRVGNGELKIYAHNTVLITITGVPTILGIATYYRVIRYPDPASLLGQPDIWVPQNYTTIQAAINAANTGDLIFVSIGTYNEHLVINKSVTLVGEDRDHTIIDGGGSGTVVTIAADNVTIGNFTICNSGKLGRGISWTEKATDNITITDNVLINHGIGITGSSTVPRGNFYIVENKMSGNLFAVQLTENNSPPTIVGNIIMQNHVGIRLESVNNTRIVGNIIFNNTQHGIRAKRMFESVLLGNNITMSGVGVSLLDIGNVTVSYNLLSEGDTNTVEKAESFQFIGNTITNNTNSGLMVINSTSAIIAGNQISSNRKHGLFIENFFKVEIEGLIQVNNVTNNSEFGLYLQNSTNVRFENNMISGNGFSGIFVNNSTNNIFASNTITNNGYSANAISYLHRSGIYLNKSDNNTFASNNISFNKDHGVAIEYSHGLNVSGNLISLNSLSGVKRMMPSPHSVPSSYVGNTITKNNIGIDFENVTSATIARNTIKHNNVGIRLFNSNNNTITHNNFIDNEQQVEATPLAINTWDDGAEGNYWSNYVSVDIATGPNQDKPGSDGIGDTWHVLDENNIDHYPLIGVYTHFSTPLGHIGVVSNSTIQDFTYFESNNTIVMRASNTTSDQTHGFCRLTIPHELLPPPYIVIVNNTEVPYNTILEKQTQSIIYFTYKHSTVEILIIPEIQSTTTILLFISLISTIMVSLAKRENKP